MNELHKQIREDSEIFLDKLTMRVHDAAEAIADKHNLNRVDLLRLAIGGKTASLSKKVVAILTANRERELLDLYQKKPELKAVGGK